MVIILAFLVGIVYGVGFGLAAAAGVEVMKESYGSVEATPTDIKWAMLLELFIWPVLIWKGSRMEDDDDASPPKQ